MQLHITKRFGKCGLKTKDKEKRRGGIPMKKNELSQYLDEKAEELFSISQDLYNYPEISE